MHKVKGSGLVPWPQRLSAAPPRLEDLGVSPEEFSEDTVSVLICISVFSDKCELTILFFFPFLTTQDFFFLPRAYGIFESLNTGNK